LSDDLGWRIIALAFDMTPEDRIKALEAAPPGGWVAFSADEERVVAYGDSYDDVVAKAEANGEPDPVITKVPPSWSTLVLAPGPSYRNT
jgi:hypothetical protein